MRPRLPWIFLLIALPVWLLASYGLRYGLMEDSQWVGTCVAEAARWECQLRGNLGLLIHFRVLGWVALVLSIIAFCVRGRVGCALAVLRHRVRIAPELDIEGLEVDHVLRQLLDQVPAPRL